MRVKKSLVLDTEDIVRECGVEKEIVVFGFFIGRLWFLVG